MSTFANNTFKYIVIVVVAIVSFSSCVAKKKFVAMEDSKNKAEMRIRDLNSQVNVMEADFEKYKNELHASNATKNMIIDSLSQQVVFLNRDVVSKSDNIEDQVFSFQVEKRRLNQLLADKDKQIQSLTQRSNLLSVQLDDLKASIQDLKIADKNSGNEIKTLQRSVKEKELRVEKLNAAIDQLKDEIITVRRESLAKDDKIEALQNQVKLLKSQFGSN